MSRAIEQASRREHPEPDEGDRPVPKIILLLIAALFLWGIYYLLSYPDYPLVGGDSRTPVQTASTGGVVVSGSAIYSSTCAACHQANGQGLAGAFPPLAGSRWVESGEHSVPVAIVIAGLSGEIEVQGSVYSGVMPGFGGQLNDAEIAAVVSYVRGAWGNAAGEISAEEVAAVRERIGDRGAWQGAKELITTFGPP